MKLGAVTSVEYQKIRFHIPEKGVGKIKSNQVASRRCTVQMLKESKKKSFTPDLSRLRRTSLLPNNNYSRQIKMMAFRKTRCQKKKDGSQKRTLNTLFLIRATGKDD